MAPDRGYPGISNQSVPENGTEPGREPEASDEDGNIPSFQQQRRPRDNSDAEEFPTKDITEPQHFTIRGVLVGLCIGVLICFSNTYFGLQTGWVSSMAMPSALIGFAYFKLVARYLKFPFSPVENVLVQSVAGSVGTMPLGCGFVGVIPALNFFLKREENGPLDISLGKLIIWGVGICFFGVVFAVPLRRQVIIREKLKFPSGTATALMIGVLHGNVGKSGLRRHNSAALGQHEERDVQEESTVGNSSSAPLLEQTGAREHEDLDNDIDAGEEQSDWKANFKLLSYSLSFSALYTFISYFLPQLRDLPVFGLRLARNWLWRLNPSPAYVGQGIIMGPETTLHMLLGALIGWGILSPLAKYKGWAPGPVSDWETGSKGWIVWVSLAIMLADAVVSLGWLILKPMIRIARANLPNARKSLRQQSWQSILPWLPSDSSYSRLSTAPSDEDANIDNAALEQSLSAPPNRKSSGDMHDPSDADAPPSHLISNRTVLVGFIISICISIFSIHYTFANLMSLPLTLLALFLALLLSVMGVRALGETDLNPVSGISKLTQLVFAFVVRSENKNAIIINLVAGALSESGALQAGDLLQDLKTGHLLGAAPSAQFYGQLIGSAVGAVVSALVYRLYANVYEIPGELFQVPTGYVWVFTARLVTGKGLPPMVWPWALGAGLLFVLATITRTWGKAKEVGWTKWIPGGIAVAVGMYNVPSFTLARTFGGLLHWYWCSHRRGRETPLIVLASGLILGEGLFSIVNLLLASFEVRHF